MKKRLFTRFIGILVPDEVYREVKQITTENEITVTTFVRELIAKDLVARQRKEKRRDQEMNEQDSGKSQKIKRQGDSSYE